jgi:hypothetical protein
LYNVPAIFDVIIVYNYRKKSFIRGMKDKTEGDRGKMSFIEVMKDKTWQNPGKMSFIRSMKDKTKKNQKKMSIIDAMKDKKLSKNPRKGGTVILYTPPRC